MALDSYRAKRNFSTSPEPAGRDGSRSPVGRIPRFFCVQKHLASHLHYDVRLEHDGVLLSWAVPKGPSLDPATRRLAMHVEDHPIEYGEFEGVIPSGYGAGIVMLWDHGTWTPEVDDVDAALRKGDLKFTLDGVKLKGSWVLVRTRGWGARGGGAGTDDGRSWLLIKHRDSWSGDLDITDFAPLSVKTGGDFADILSEDHPDIWRSNRPAQGGETGALFARIIARALALRDARASEGSESAAGQDPSAPRRTASPPRTPAAVSRRRTAKPKPDPAAPARTPAARATAKPRARRRTKA